MSTWSIHPGDTRASLARLPERSVRCCVTSPPYFGLRDYGHDGQIGLEASPAAYIAALVDVFAGVRRVLTDDGTLWVNLGDSYNAYNGNRGLSSGLNKNPQHAMPSLPGGRGLVTDTLKNKDLMMMPARVAIALQDDGWYLRSDIIWHKPNPMPESVTDRPTKAHEYLFLLAKSERYFYDHKAIAEPCEWNPDTAKMPDGWDTGEGAHGAFHRNGREKGATKMPPIGGKKKAGGDNATYSGNTPEFGTTRNKRDVWTIATQPYSGAHFATFPEALVEPCILAGSAVGDTVLDPFSGSGTTGAVAVRHGRNYIGCELNPAYIALSEKRIGDEAPLFVAGGAA